MKNSRKISDLFYNNRFLLIFSVVAAVIIWVVVAVEFSPETTITVRNVPIRISSTGLIDSKKLEAFGAENLTVDVTVVGKRYIVEDDSIINDLDAVANTASVTKSGTHKLSVDVGSVSTRPQYEIVSYTVSEVEVLFDYYVEKQVPVEPVVSVENGSFAADGYFAEDFEPAVEKVTIYGPKSEVESVMKVDAYATVAGNLKDNNGFTASLKLAKQNGDTPKYVGIKAVTEEMANGSIYINTLIYKEAKASAAVTFTDVPAGIADAGTIVEYKVEPAQAVFGFSDVVSESVPVATISFNEIDFRNKGEQIFVREYSGKEGVVIKDEETGKPGTGSFTVTVTVKNVGYVTVDLPTEENPYAMKDISNRHGLKYEIVGYGKQSMVGVFGASENVYSVSAQDLQLDFSSVAADATGVIEVPVILGRDSCWLDGEPSDYTVKVNIIR